MTLHDGERTEEMEKFAGWLKKERIPLVKSLLSAALPLVCCLVYCGMRGRSLGEVYLPASPWNDEMLYYKQVESIIHFGYPQGYCGYNESHALKLSFGAWSPVLIFPWIFWGLLFGWNLMSPIVCNIVLMTLCCFLFVWLTRPTWKQLGILCVLFCLYTPFARYMLSAMPEVICFSMLITFYGLAVNYLRREKIYKLALLFVLSSVMTLMRPYLALFMLLPACFWIRRDRKHAFRWVAVVGSALVLGTALGLYACIKHYLGAEYFAPLFYTDWIYVYFERGIPAGIRNTLETLYYKGSGLLEHMRQGFRDGEAAGAYFAGYAVCMCILVVQSFLDWRSLRRSAKIQEETDEKEEAAQKEAANLLIVEAHLAFSFIVMLFALLLMYTHTEGSKHLLTFMAAAVFVTALMKTKFLKKAVVLGVTFAYFYSYMAVEPYDYEAPFVSEEKKAAVAAFEEALAPHLVLERENAPNYENVVIWVLDDMVAGASAATDWQLLYGLPEGFGINCCRGSYITEHFESLQSRYLVSPAGGEIDAMCREAGYSLLYGDSRVVFYERTP
ncbi:MAG: hypothetical protein NC389_09195 [Acetatifactor muris]|nr:hypothetical protein [Acetatifactor muris]